MRDNCQNEYNKWKTRLAYLFLLLVAALASAQAASNLTLVWDANSEPDLVGYRLKYGTTSGSYSQTVDVGNATTATVPNLSSGRTYYFVVTAYDSESLESTPSGEVSYTTPPNVSPVVSLASPVSGANATAPASFTLTAAASDSDGSITRVEFFQGSTKLGEATSSPYSLVWSGVPAGSYSLTARATDNQGATAYSSSVSVTVAAPAAAPKPGISAVTYHQGVMLLTVTGEVGSMTSLYASADMVNWGLVSTAQNTTGTQILYEQASSYTQRFYRVTNSTGTSDPVGFLKIQVSGTTTSQVPTVSYLGNGLLNPVSYQGAVSSWNPQVVGDSSATWSAGQFTGASGEFYLEIVTGPHAGVMTDIVAMDATSRTLTTDDDLSTYLQGAEQYKIRKHRTLADLFGSSNEAGLLGGSTVANADEIRVFNPTTQLFATYYYKTGGFGGTGWRSTADALADAAGTKLYPDQGVVIKRKAASSLTLVLKGAVKSGPTVIPVGPKMNLVANLYPAGLLTLGNSGLRTGNDSLGIAGGSSVSAADEVRIYDGTVFRTYFFKTGGFGGIGWRETSDALSDAAATPIPVGSAIFVIRKNDRPAFAWSMPQPF